MSTLDYLDLLSTYKQKKIFRTVDFATLLGRNMPTARVELSRLVTRGLLDRPSKGLYLNPYNPPTQEELAMVLRSPAYISMESALARHGILSQSPFTMTLVTTSSTGTIDAMKTRFEYHNLQSPWFIGYHRSDTYNIAESEKALCDLVYLRYRRKRELSEERMRSLLDDMNLDELHKVPLRRYAHLMHLEDDLRQLQIPL
ncbi:MAG: type IV toxin-antitoxin system AbiEi family antitoxin domain-containing protein [Candidatus Cryosericum sp.]